MKCAPKAIAIFFLVAISVPGLMAQEPEAAPIALGSMLSADKAAELARTGELSAVFQRGSVPTLVPEGAFRDLLRRGVAELDPLLGVELAVFSPMNPGAASGPDRLLALYNTLRRVSTLKGLEYFSASRGRMHTLFNDAYAVASSDQPERLPDPVVTAVSEYSAITVLEDDTSFGRNLFSMEFRAQGGVVLVETTNLNTIWYGILPLIPPRGLKQYALAARLDGDVFFYALAAINGLDLFGLVQSRADSLHNRLKALWGWFWENYIKTGN